MAGGSKKERSDPSELEPAIPKVVKTDQVSAVIGEVGRWQLEKILIVFLAAAPGERREVEGWETEDLSLFQASHIFSTLASSLPSRSSGVPRLRTRTLEMFYLLPGM